MDTEVPQFTDFARSSRQRKGRKKISRSAHLIETQQMTGGLCAKVSEEDLQIAAQIKTQRLLKGLRRTTRAEEGQETADSDSSWGMKFPSPTSSTGGIHAAQVCSLTESDSPLRKTLRIDSAIGVVYGTADAIEQSTGAIGLLK